MANNILIDPHGSYYFVLEIDSVEVAHFMEFSGLKSTCEIFEIPEGGFNGQVHKFPGVSKWENLTLRYCTQASTALFEWRQDYVNDKFKDRAETSGAVVMKNNAGDEIKRFSFGAMWPVSWEGPALNSGSSELAIETLEVAFDRFTMDDDDPGPEELYEPPPYEIVDDQMETPPVQFEYNSEELTPEGQEVVDNVAETLNSEENKDVEEMWVEGHTCTDGSWHYNKSLSEGRARVVMTELRAKCPDKKFYSRGYSWKYPTSSNATEGGRAANRRTEFMTSSPKDRGVDDSEPASKPS
jgi:phage tail-like protein